MQVPDLVVQQGYKLCPEVNLLGGRACQHLTTQSQGTVEGPGGKTLQGDEAENERYVQNTSLPNPWLQLETQSRSPSQPSQVA